MPVGKSNFPDRHHFLVRFYFTEVASRTFRFWGGVGSGGVVVSLVKHWTPDTGGTSEAWTPDAGRIL